MIEALRAQFPWLAEYVDWQGSRVNFRCPVPRYTLRYAQQRAWFQARLPGHVLLIRQGGYWVMERPAGLTDARLATWPPWAVAGRFPQRRLTALNAVLWESGLPVAWIEETGRRLGNIAERALTCRWPGCGEILATQAARRAFPLSLLRKGFQRPG